jgi:transposase-like protein
VLANREAHGLPAPTTSIEHDHAEVRRRTGAIRALPNEPAFVRPVIALAIACNEQWLVRRYVTATADARYADEHARMAA